MPQHYSNPKRATQAHALPDIETFHAEAGEWGYDENGERCEAEDGEPNAAGWYYWYSLPGCLPDSEPNGPFDTEEAAVADMLVNAGNDDDA